MRKSVLMVCIFLVFLAFAHSYSKEALVISFTGDILLSRGVGEKLLENGFDYPFVNVRRIFEKDDLTVSNLEGPITEEKYPIYKNRKNLFKADPSSGSALAQNGFDLLNLSNNHTMDYGYRGLMDTMAYLEESNLTYVGAGGSYKEARELKIHNLKGANFGFLSYSVFPPEGYIYSENRADVALYDPIKSLEIIRESKDKCDYLVVSIHWGNEFEHYPTDVQKQIAHNVIESGGDVIIGHHPHVLQSVERYKGKYIFYSLGNFVFDRQIRQGTENSVILQMYYTNVNDVKWGIIPVEIVDSQPKIAGYEKSKSIIEEINTISKDAILQTEENGIWNVN